MKSNPEVMRELHLGNPEIQLCSNGLRVLISQSFAEKRGNSTNFHYLQHNFEVQNFSELWGEIERRARCALEVMQQYIQQVEA